MGKKNKKKNIDATERELTRKEVRLRAKDQARNRKIWTSVGLAIGLALLVVLIGAVMELAVTPNLAVATVGEDRITTGQYRERVLLQNNQLTNRLVEMIQLEQQFGGQGFFTNQINQLQSILGSPESLGIQVLDQLIDEKIILQEAERREITVSDEEVNEALREEIAAAQRYVTEPQATSTAEAAVAATVTAEASTPTAIPTLDVSSTITATATPLPTPTAWLLITSDIYDTGVVSLTNSLDDTAGMSLTSYREVIRARLVAEKLNEAVADDEVAVTEEQLNARHILLQPRDPTPLPTAVPDDQPTPEPTLEPTEVPEGAPAPAPTPGPRTREETLTEITTLRSRIVDDGEDFAEIAAEFSDDQSNAADGGNLDWFGPGRMVPEFEEAAFALEIGEVSEPISTTFGYHLIEVLEKDSERPKEEAQIEQERSQAFQSWLQETKAAAEIERPEDIVSKLPASIRRGAEQPVGPINLPGGHGGF